MKTIVNIKTDKVVKLAAKRAAEEIGVPLSTIINAFLRKFAREKTITFSAVPQPSEYLRQTIAEAERELIEGKVAGPFSTITALRADLES